MRKAILAEEKRTGDKYHLPVAAVAMAALMSLPHVGFILPGAEAAAILTSVMATLGMQYTGDGAAKICTVINEDNSGSPLKKSYLVKLKPALLVVTLLFAAIFIVSVGMICYSIGMQNADLSPVVQLSNEILPPVSNENVTTEAVNDTSEADETAERYADIVNDGVTYTYALIDGTAAITGVSINDDSKAVELIIPETIDGYTVSAIGEGAFAGCETVESVIIPDSVVSIGERAFYECINLKNVKFPDKLEVIGAHAFSFCHKINELSLPGSLDAERTFTDDTSPFACMRGLDKITVDQHNRTMRVIDNVLYTYDLATMLLYPSDSHAYSYTISSTVKKLGAYSLCSNHINTLTIPSSVTVLGPYSLAYCYSITVLKVNNSVTVFGENALAMPGLEYIYAWSQDRSITLNKSIICSSRGVLYSMDPNDRTTNDHTVLIRYPAAMDAESYSITSNFTKRIAQYAFYDADRLKSLKMNNSVEVLEASALAGMENLTELTLSDNITHLSEYALAYNPSIISYTMPRQLKSFDVTAFFGCGNLKKIVFTGEVIPCPEEGIALPNDGVVFFYPADIPEWADSEWAKRYTLIADPGIVSVRRYNPGSEPVWRTIHLKEKQHIPIYSGGHLLSDTQLKTMAGMPVDEAAKK